MTAKERIGYSQLAIALSVRTLRRNTPIAMANSRASLRPSWDRVAALPIPSTIAAFMPLLGLTIPVPGLDISSFVTIPILSHDTIAQPKYDPWVNQNDGTTGSLGSSKNSR